MVAADANATAWRFGQAWWPEDNYGNWTAQDRRRQAKALGRNLAASAASADPLRLPLLPRCAQRRGAGGCRAVPVPVCQSEGELPCPVLPCVRGRSCGVRSAAVPSGRIRYWTVSMRSLPGRGDCGGAG
jgi:hypothetical protein